MDNRIISTIALPMMDEISLEVKLDYALELLELAVIEGAQFVCFPESINRYRGNTPATAQEIELKDYALAETSTAIQPFYDAAKKHGISIVLPLLIREGDGYFNRSLFINEHGKIIARYDKLYLAPGETEEGIIPGKNPVVANWGGVKVGFMTCFDMNYQDLVIQYKKLGVKLIAFSSMYGGGRLLNSYALLYGMHFVSAYSDWSRFVDALGYDHGGIGMRLESYRFGILTPVLTHSINFDYERLHLVGNQQKFSAIRKKYGRQVHIEIDQGSAFAVIESLSEEFSVGDIISEFELSIL